MCMLFLVFACLAHHAHAHRVPKNIVDESGYDAIVALLLANPLFSREAMKMQLDRNQRIPTQGHVCRRASTLGRQGSKLGPIFVKGNLQAGSSDSTQPMWLNKRLGNRCVNMVALAPPSEATNFRRPLLLQGVAAVTGLASMPRASAAQVDLIDDESGLRWGDLRAGAGPEPQKGTIVTIDYMMTRRAGAKIFSTKDAGQPFSWALGDGTVIEGLEMGILGYGNIPPMKPGGIRRLLIPQALGYGVGRGLIENLENKENNFKERLPMPPQGFVWIDRNNDKVDAYKRFMDTYMNELRLDEPDLILDVILYGPAQAAAEAQ